MAAKGSYAKEQVVDVIKKAFGNNYVGTDGKKFYVWSEENGENMQVAIALTCPKVPFGVDAVPAGAVQVANGFDWSMSSQEAPAPAEITQEEKDNIDRLMATLGLK